MTLEQQFKVARPYFGLLCSTLDDLIKEGHFENYDFYIENSADKLLCIAGFKVWRPKRTDAGIIVPFEHETVFKWEKLFPLKTTDWINLFALISYDEFMAAMEDLTLQIISAFPRASVLKHLTN